MPIFAIWPWIVGLLGSVATTAFTFFLGRVATEAAFRYALITACLVAVAGLFLALTLSLKALVIGARVAMPNSLGQLTYFLPGSIAQIFSVIVTVRVSISIYRWTVATFTSYLPAGGNYRNMGI